MSRPLLTFLARRLAYSLVVLFGVLIVVFALVQLVPGDPPVRIALGTRYTPEPTTPYAPRADWIVRSSNSSSVTSARR